MTAVFNQGVCPAAQQYYVHTFSRPTIRNEPNFTMASGTYAAEHGGYWTERVLAVIAKLVPNSLHRLRVDVRTHCLQPGEYPWLRIVWHTDFETTSRGLDEVDPANRKTQIFTFSSDEPTMEFVRQRNITLAKPRLELDSALINKLMNFGTPSNGLWRAKPNYIVCYDSTELHRPTKWEGAPNHWRYFLRATLFADGDPRQHVFNEAVFKGPSRSIYKEKP